MKYKIHKKTTLHQSFFRLEVFDVEHERFDGGALRIQRELLERGDAVAILLYDKKADEVLLIEQFRIGPVARAENPWMIEIVAGMVDGDEDKEAAVIRESIEESGYQPNDVNYLGQYYATPGGSSESIALYLGFVHKDKPIGKGGGLDVEHEDIRCFWVGREQAVNMVQSGQINSGAPMLAILLAFGVQGCVQQSSMPTR